LRVAPADAVAQLAWALGWNGGSMPVFVNGRRKLRRGWRDGPELHRLASRLDLERSAEVSVGLPEVNGWVMASTVLWASVRGSEQVERVRTFRRKPSVVLKLGLGSERLCLWLLREPVDVGLVEAANRKLAYALRAVQKGGRAEDLRVPLPGTFLRLGRARPAPVTVTRLDLDAVFTHRGLVGGLKDPPPADLWRERQR
jgi:hypothetical protein